MRRIIKNKVYDTKKARLLRKETTETVETGLYRKITGEFFLCLKKDGNETIEPVCYEELEKVIRKSFRNGTDLDSFIKDLLPRETEEGKERATYYLKKSTVALILDNAMRRKKSASGFLDDYLQENLKKND